MPPIRSAGGRASKACISCRKQKTRCYEAGAGSRACLRCTTLSQRCSLEDSLAHSHPDGVAAVQAGHDCSAVEERVVALEHLVKDLMDLVKPLRSNHESNAGQSHRFMNDGDAHANGNEAAPLIVLRDAATDAGLTGHRGNNAVRDATIVEKGIITASEVDALLSVFCRHYGRWCGLDEDANDAANALKHTASPLLLCVSCLIAARHVSQNGSNNASPMSQTGSAIYEEALKLLNNALLQADQELDFFLAVILLSLWPTTITASPLKLDSWMVTGFALQHALVSTAFKDNHKSMVKSVQSVSQDPDARRNTWVILALSHMYACIGTRRKCMLSEQDTVHCLTSLDVSVATNFEMRMTAELELYWQLYKQTDTKRIALSHSQSILREWREKWDFAFNQPRPYFLQLGYQFAQLLLYEQALNTRSAAVRESLVSEMTRLCSTIISLVTQTLDDRTQYLTDHIYHVVAFAAITLCRLLCKYEKQLGTVHDVPALDTKVYDLMSWLGSIGSAVHISRAMASVVGATFCKLRPGRTYGTSTMNTESDMPNDLVSAELPEFLNMDVADADWDSLLPDWQSLVSEDMQAMTPG